MKFERLMKIESDRACPICSSKLDLYTPPTSSDDSNQYYHCTECFEMWVK